MDKIYKACADASRRKILKLLRERDMTAGELAAHFSVTKPTLTRHFAILREAGLIWDLKIGRHITYHINANVLENALLSLMEEYDFVWMPSGDIVSVARHLVESLIKEDFVEMRRHFDTQMATQLTPATLKEILELTIRQFGPFVKQLDTQMERYWDCTAVIVTCEFARAKLDVKVTFNRTGKVSGFELFNTGNCRIMAERFARTYVS